MMRTKKFFQFLTKFGSLIATWVGIITAIGILIGQISKFIDWGTQGFFAELALFVQENSITLWLVALWLVVLGIGFRQWQIYKKFAGDFSDSFKSDLSDNWEFKGGWRKYEPGTLLVTRSGDGGITKVGTYWENYKFTFKARILNECLGVIVRAQNLNNYYMFQIRHDRIRPHRRAMVPVIVQPPLDEMKLGGEPELHGLQIMDVWQFEDHNNNDPAFNFVPLVPSIDDRFFDVEINVRGQDIKISIDGRPVFSKDNFLQIPTGKVGFRNDGEEAALVKDVKVTMS